MTRGAILPVVLLLAAACESPQPPRSFVVIDSAGIEIVENDFAALDVEEWRLADEPIFSVGDPAPTADYELYRVYYPRSFPDGRVAVSMNLMELRVFDEGGSFLSSIGREGEGPGEFQFLWDAHPLDDGRIRTFDVVNRRIGFYDATTGELLHERPLETPFSNPNGVAPLADDRYAGFISSAADDDPTLPDIFVLVHAKDGSGTDTVGAIDAPDPPQPRPNTTRMFTPRFSSTASGSHVWAGWHGAYEIHRFDADGGLDRIIRSTVPAAPVTEAIRDSAGAQPTEGGVTRERLFPPHLPYWSKLLATPSGWLWVRRYPSPIGGAPNTWDIFDPEGRQVATIRIPSTARIAELGDDYVLGIFRNDLGVERVAKYSVVRPENRVPGG